MPWYHQLYLRSNNRVALIAGASRSDVWDTLEDKHSEDEPKADSGLATESIGEREARHDEQMLYVPEHKAERDRANVASFPTSLQTLLSVH